MEFKEFEEKIIESKKLYKEGSSKYNIYSMLSTSFAVLSPILIAQVNLFWLRFIGAALLLVNYFISKQMDKYFIQWLGNKRYYSFLRVEYFEFRTGVDHYLGLKENEKDVMVKNQMKLIYEDAEEYKSIMDINAKNLDDNIKELNEEILTIEGTMRDLVVDLLDRHNEAVTQKRFEHYVKSRYLDQLLWFYKRINPVKEGMKENDIKKSVYFNYMFKRRMSIIFKILSIVITMMTLDILLETLFPSNFEIVSLYLVLIATIFSIISSTYSERDKIQNNKENTLHYLQTVKALMRLYRSFYDKFIEKSTDLERLAKFQSAFVSKCESIFTQESVKWSEIQSADRD